MLRDDHTTEIEENILESFPIVANLQNSIIRYMLENIDFARQCCLYLKPHYFSNYQLGWFVKFIQNYFKTYEKIPKPTVIENEITKFKQEDQLGYKLVFEKILTADLSDTLYLEDQLTRFIQDTIFKRKFEESRNYFNEGNDKEAMHVIEDLMEERDKVDFKKKGYFEFKNSWELFDQLEASMKQRLPLGIPPIDEALLGGIPRKRLMTIIGGTNIGKSVILINFLVNFVKDGRRVLYIDLENEDQETITRIHSCYTGIQFNKFYRNRFNGPEKVLINEAINTLSEKAMVQFFYKDKFTIEDLVAFVETQKLKFNFDVLLLDYAQLLDTETKHSNLYMKHGEIFRRLALLAIRADIALITVAQVNRGGQYKNTHGSKKEHLVEVTDVADSFEAIRKSSIVIPVTKSKKNAENNELIFSLAKQRLGVTDVCVKFTTDFGCIRVFNKNMPYELYNEGGDIKELEKLMEEDDDVIKTKQP